MESGGPCGCRWFPLELEKMTTPIRSVYRIPFGFKYLTELESESESESEEISSYSYATVEKRYWVFLQSVEVTRTDGSMVSVNEIFPPSKSTGSFFYNPSSDPWFEGFSSQSVGSAMMVIKPMANPPPPYVKRTWEAGIKETRQSIMAKWRYLQPKDQSSSNPKFIKYKSSAPGAKDRMIMMVDKQVDPLDPSNFKHKRLPKPPPSPPVPVMHSPPRPLTVKEQQDWKIPPCISLWKNRKGYTIPLSKRLAADRRKLQQVQINENFSKLSEALYVAEHKAREAVAMRSKVQKELMLKEKDQKEQKLRALAQKARSERTLAAPLPTTLKETRPSGSKRDRPVEFGNDPFGLEQFLREVKKGKNKFPKCFDEVVATGFREPNAMTLSRKTDSGSKRDQDRTNMKGKITYLMRRVVGDRTSHSICLAMRTWLWLRLQRWSYFFMI